MDAKAHPKPDLHKIMSAMLFREHCRHICFVSGAGRNGKKLAFVTEVSPSRTYTAQCVIPTSEIRPSAESQQDVLHFYVYSVYVK